MLENILLVEPDFPIPSKSRNHKNFLPIGLLKLASYYREKGNTIKLVRGEKSIKDFNPHRILITSLFTYWSKYVVSAVHFYRDQFPKAIIEVGGIYASLMGDDCKKRTGCNEVFKGVHESAELLSPAYDLVDVNYQIIHTTRGCFRRCPFCGTWRIESGFSQEKFANYFKIGKYDFIAKRSIIDEVKKFYPKQNKLIFYDNNLLFNPYLSDILKEIIDFNRKIREDNRGKSRKKPYLICESQSGFDGRILDLEISKLLKDAKFIYPRIAWDNSYDEWREIKKQVGILEKAGFSRRDIFVFVLYNWKYDYEVLENKRVKCYECGVQLADCRFRPLDQTFDNYNPRKKQQSNKEYFIHPNWTDHSVRLFRKNVRRHNICIRYSKKFHSYSMERKDVDKEEFNRIMKLSKIEITQKVDDAWFPDEFTHLYNKPEITEFPVIKI